MKWMWLILLCVVGLIPLACGRKEDPSNVRAPLGTPRVAVPAPAGRSTSGGPIRRIRN